MIEKRFDIQEYMTHGVERIVSDVLRATLKNPKRKRLYGAICSRQQDRIQEAPES